MVSQGAIPGNAPTQLSHLGGANHGNPTAHGRSAKCHGSDDRSHGHGVVRAKRQFHWESRRDQRQDHPKSDPERNLNPHLVPDTKWDVERDPLVRLKHKSRSHERNCTQGHDSGDVELEGPRHLLPRTFSHYQNCIPIAFRGVMATTY